MTEIGCGSSNGSSDEFNRGYGGRLSALVMVQREIEMENWRSPLASLREEALTAAILWGPRTPAVQRYASAGTTLT